MLFQTPTLDAAELAVLEQLDEFKRSLRYSLHEPKRWDGSLRRLSFARNIQGSNSIEGFDAASDDAAAIAVGEEPLDTTTEARLALDGYRTAMTYVLQLSEEAEDFRYSTQFLEEPSFHDDQLLAYQSPWSLASRTDLRPPRGNRRDRARRC